MVRAAFFGVTWVGHRAYVLLVDWRPRRFFGVNLALCLGSS
jgi:hypothetical protein